MNEGHLTPEQLAALPDSAVGYGRMDTSDRERIVYEDRGLERRAESQAGGGPWQRIAADAVQRLADSDPDDAAIDAMERLRGTAAESFFVVDAETLERVIGDAIEDAAYDAAPAPSPTASRADAAATTPAGGDICEREPWATVFRYMASRLLPYRPSYQLAANALEAARAELRALAAENAELRNQRGTDSGLDCVYCGMRIYGTFIGAGNGSGQSFADPACFYRAECNRLEIANSELRSENARLAASVAERRESVLIDPSGLAEANARLAARVEELEQSIHDIVTAGDAEASKLRRAFRIAPDGRSLQEQLLEVAQQQSAQPSGDVGEAMEQLAGLAREHRDPQRAVASGQIEMDLATITRALARGEQAERYTETLLAQLARLFAWGDRSALHAIMHIDNAVLNLRTDLSVAEAERDALRERCERLAKAAAALLAFVGSHDVSTRDSRRQVTLERELSDALAAAKEGET